jgi:uncharacterized protein
MNQQLIHVPTNDNKLLEEILERINNNVEVKTLWKIMNINAIDRLGMTDHGPVHFQIVSNIALRLTRLLLKKEVKLSIPSDYGLSSDYSELVIFLASIFHDLGMSVSRDGHEEFSLFLANSLLHQILDFLPEYERTIVISETLHCIISHRDGGKPYTIEAGIVRVADALDMSKGRSRIPYSTGKVSIHSVSAAAIENVEIIEGEDKPIQINISMNNSAGLFQVDELLKVKLKGSGLEKYVDVKAFIEGETEKQLVKEFIIRL